jgi:hypothetical protein
MPGGYKNIKPGDNPKPFKKGQIGNPKGRPKLPDLDELLALVLGDVKQGKTAAQAILEAQRMKAVKGDTRAAEMLLDRGYGKATQTVDTKTQVSVLKVQTQIIPCDVPIASNEKEVDL